MTRFWPVGSHRPYQMEGESVAFRFLGAVLAGGGLEFQEFFDGFSEDFRVGFDAGPKLEVDG